MVCFQRTCYGGVFDDNSGIISNYPYEQMSWLLIRQELSPDTPPNPF